MLSTVQAIETGALRVKGLDTTFLLRAVDALTYNGTNVHHWSASVYLVLKGTRVRVRKPDGTVVAHTMKRNVAIPCGEAHFLGYDLHYRLNDYTIIVSAEKAEYVNSQCPQCKRLL